MRSVCAGRDEVGAAHDLFGHEAGTDTAEHGHLRASRTVEGVVGVGCGDRGDDPAAVTQLRGERVGHGVDGERDHHRVVGRCGLPARQAVTDDDCHRTDAVVGQRVTGAPGQLLVDLDTDHVCDQARQQRGLVAGARADLQHRVVAGQVQRLEHARLQRRLARRLPVPDRHRTVVVGALRQILRQEGRAIESEHRSDDAFVDHPCALRGPGERAAHGPRHVVAGA